MIYSRSRYRATRVSHGRRNRPVKHRTGSREEQIEIQLRDLVLKVRGTPSTYALMISRRLGFLVKRQTVWRCLNRLNMTRKKASIVPGFSIPWERDSYLRHLYYIWQQPDQVLFVDEKKFKNAELFERATGYGYAEAGQDLPRSTTESFSLLRPLISKTIEVVGALGYLKYAPRPLRDGSEGNVGLWSFCVRETKLTSDDVCLWVEHDLAPMLHRGQYVVFDNMSSHRKNRARLETALNARGCFLLWNPPQSPDLNPIEKLWDIVLAHSKRYIIELAIGLHGPARRFAEGDLMVCLKHARLSLHAFHDMLNR
jgi:hypothetical protein